ncbi:MAG: TerC/Alx family metal homeostasis membrane protein [Alphaproteobacteria bacterium]
MAHMYLGWALLGIAVSVLLILDLGVFHKNPHKVSLKESIRWSVVWVVLSLLFGVGIVIDGGVERGILFFTSYLVEKSLSIDNIFLFTLIFSSLQIQAKYQHRVLFWGVLGALVMRAAMLLGGLSLIEQFEWLLLVFGGILVVTGVKLLMASKETSFLENSFVQRLIAWFPFDKSYQGKAFWIKNPEGAFIFTPLFMALVLVELADLVFALDSIPAVLAITQDPFLVYSSNVLAILGLRSLYFVLVYFVDRFGYLKKGIAVVLCFIGVKMLIADFFKIPATLSLVFIVCILGCSILMSRKNQKRGEV